MERYRLGHAAADDWREAADACLDRLGAVPAEANLGFVYVTDHFAGELGAIVGRLEEATRVRQWVGSVGVGVCATGAEYFGRPAMAVMAADFPEASFRVFDKVGEDLLRGAGASRGGGRDAPVFGVVHADPRSPDTPETIVRLADATGGFLVGGLTSSEGAYAQVAGRVTEGGISGVLFSPEVTVATGLSQGCSPMGPVRRVTECFRNIAVQIDGRPALEVFKEDIGAELASDLRRVAGYVYVAFLVKGSDTGDYLVRNLVGIDPEAGLIGVSEPLQPGDAIMFCRRDRESAEDDLRRMLRDLKRRVGGAKGGLYFSCVARGPNLFGDQSEELEAIRQELGEVPLVGFFCNGEISNNRLYGYTGVLTLFLST
ncbi:MAG: FIST N-terminal domain-containing protein [Alphaproteobacteria bacterium]